jgi:quercetin dioxygenase-like cupin family protein
VPDPAHAERPLATATVQVDDDRVVVTEWRFPPGGHTGWHRHRWPYVVVPMTGGTLLLDTPDGPREAVLVAGVAYSREAGVEHDVVNANEDEFVFVEVEFKQG